MVDTHEEPTAMIISGGYVIEKTAKAVSFHLRSPTLRVIKYGEVLRAEAVGGRVGEGSLNSVDAEMVILS